MLHQVEPIGIIKTFADQAAYDAYVLANKTKPRAIKFAQTAETCILATYVDVSGAIITKCPFLVGQWEASYVGGFVSTTVRNKLDTADVTAVVFYGF